MVLEELLHKSKEIVKNDKDKDIDNIYNLLIDVSNAKYPLAEYGGLSGSNCEIKYPEMSKEELREFEKEAERQYDARTEEISKIAENVENYVEEKYPSIRIDGYPESHWCDAFGTHMKHYFLSATYSPNETNNVRQDSEIKLYFNMPYEKIEDFFKECASFAIENNIFMYYKTRYENATDMVTVRFYDIEKLDGIVNIIKKYRTLDKENPLMDTKDGIGYTLDCGESYNKTLCKLICDYVSNTEEINTNNFIEYLNELKKNIKLPNFINAEDKDNALYVHYKNLDNLINGKEFELDEFKEKYKELLEIRKNCKKEKQMKKEYVDSLLNDISKVGNESTDKMYETIDSIINDEEKTVNINEKEIKIIDILKEKYPNEDIKEEMIKNCSELVEYRKDRSIDKIKSILEEFTTEIMVELAKVGMQDETLMMQKINSIMEDNKPIISYKNIDMTVGNAIEYTMKDCMENRDIREVLYNTIMEYIKLTNELVEIIDENKEKDIIYLADEIYDNEDDFWYKSENDEDEDDDYYCYNENKCNNKIFVPKKYELRKRPFEQLIAYKCNIKYSENMELEDIIRKIRKKGYAK